ncbi:MAG: hypothetical protein RR342_02105 [Bacilli bacterium]
MEELIYEGFLNRKEYFTLLLKKRTKFIFIYITLLLTDIIFAILFALTFTLEGWKNELSLKIIFISICSLVSICIGIIYFFTITTGIKYIYGDVKVYKKENLLLINSQYKGKLFSYSIIAKEKVIEYDHLLIKDNGSNFIFLPKELLQKI